MKTLTNLLPLAKHPLPRFAGVALLLAVLAAVFSIGTSAAGPGDTPTKKTDGPKAAALVANLGKVTLGEDQVKTNKKTPIPHKPLEMVDLKTGQKVTAEKALTLENGKKTTYGTYYTELNKLEKKFNELGYTFRDKNNTKVLLHQTRVNEQDLEDQGKKLTAAHVAFDPKTMHAVPKAADIEKKHLDSLKAGARSLTDGTTGGTAKPVQASREWNYVLGNKKLVAGYLNGKIEIKGDTNGMTATGNAAAGGYLLNKDLNLIKANGSVYAPAQGQTKTSFHVYLLGQHVVNLDKSANTSVKLSDHKSHSLDVHSQMEFSIGPIPVTAKVGVKGNVGVNYLFTASPTHASMQVGASVDAKVYAQVSVDLFLASAGAGGEVTLLKDDLTFGAELDLKLDPTRGPLLTEHVYAQNKMTLLSGRLYAFAKVNYLFGSHEWQHDLFSWKGLQTNGYLFNIHNENALIPNFQPVAAK